MCIPKHTVNIKYCFDSIIMNNVTIRLYFQLLPPTYYIVIAIFRTEKKYQSFTNSVQRPHKETVSLSFALNISRTVRLTIVSEDWWKIKCLKKKKSVLMCDNQLCHLTAVRWTSAAIYALEHRGDHNTMRWSYGTLKCSIELCNASRYSEFTCRTMKNQSRNTHFND